MKKYLILGGICIIIVAISSYFLYFSPVTFSSIMDRQLVYMRDGQPTKINIIFSKDRVYGYGGVNRYFGSYQQQEQKLSFGPMATTQMAGLPEDMSAEYSYLQTLNQVTSIKTLRKNKITLETASGQLLEFKPDNQPNAEKQ